MSIITQHFRIYFFAEVDADADRITSRTTIPDMFLFHSYDYVEISSQDNFRFGKYCGEESGTTIEVTGDYAVIRFHSDSNVQKRGFSLLFTSVLPSGYNKYNKYLSG